MLDTLRIFLDLVETGSFSEAAARNALTQSAVSQRIRKLEDELGHRLIERSRHMEPTEAGRLFYQTCKDIVARYETATVQLDAMRSTTCGDLRVGTIPTVGLHVLPPYVKAFLRRCPAVHLDLEYSNCQRIYEGLLNCSLDLGIVAFPGKHPQIVSKHFRYDELVVITPPDHPLAQAGKIRVTRIRDEPFVAFDHMLPSRRRIDSLLRRARVDVRITNQFDNVETVKRAVEVGAGIAIVPRNTVERELAAGSLHANSIMGKNWQRPLAVVHRKGRALSAAAQAFIESLDGGPESVHDSPRAREPAVPVR